MDRDQRCVLHIADDRRADSVVPYFPGLSEAERGGIQAIAMARGDPDRKTVREQVPDGERTIGFDTVHVLQPMGAAVDQVRTAESRVLAADGEATLTGTKSQWLKNPVNLTRNAWRAVAALRESTVPSARAWAIKESLRPLWDDTDAGAARPFVKRWDGWATHSRLAPIITVARMLTEHLENILTYLTHRRTTAVTEGLNAKIQRIECGARGFRNRESFKTAILFHCGGLDLEPRGGLDLEPRLA